jgi:hypothetical protein
MGKWPGPSGNLAARVVLVRRIKVKIVIHMVGDVYCRSDEDVWNV